MYPPQTFRSNSPVSGESSRRSRRVHISRQTCPCLLLHLQKPRYSIVGKYLWSALSSEYGSAGYGCQSCSWSTVQGKCFFSCPGLRLRIWPRETCYAVPSRVRSLILHTEAESDWSIWYFLTGSLPLSATASTCTVNHHWVNPEIVYRVTQLRTDGVHCRESAGTEPVVLKVLLITGVTLSGFTMGQFLCASLFPHPLLACSMYVSMYGHHIQQG